MTCKQTDVPGYPAHPPAPTSLPSLSALWQPLLDRHRHHHHHHQTQPTTMQSTAAGPAQIFMNAAVTGTQPTRCYRLLVHADRLPSGEPDGLRSVLYARTVADNDPTTLTLYADGSGNYQGQQAPTTGVAPSHRALVPRHGPPVRRPAHAVRRVRAVGRVRGPVDGVRRALGRRREPGPGPHGQRSHVAGDSGLVSFFLVSFLFGC